MRNNILELVVSEVELIAGGGKCYCCTGDGGTGKRDFSGVALTR
jgi:hypothetical protein